MLAEATSALSEKSEPAFSIVKLPCRGVMLLTWRGAQEADPGLPAPSAVVARLIEEVHSGKRPPLK